jgi:hypothetical protein
MDPHTLAYLAGQNDFSATKRYVHTQADTVRAALERARGIMGIPAKPNAKPGMIPNGIPG